MTILDRIFHPSTHNDDGKRPADELAEGAPATKVQRTEAGASASSSTTTISSTSTSVHTESVASASSIVSAVAAPMDTDDAEIIEEAMVRTHQVTKEIITQHHIDQPVMHEHHVEQRIVHEHHVEQPVVHEHHVDKTIVHEHHVDQNIVHEHHKDKEIIHEKHSTKDIIHETHIDKEIVHEKHMDQPVIHEKHIEQPVIHEKHIERPILHEQHVTQPILHEQHSVVDVIHEVHQDRPVIHEHHINQDIIHERHIDKPIIHERHIVRPIVHEVHVNKPILHEHQTLPTIVKTDTKALTEIVKSDTQAAAAVVLTEREVLETVVHKTHENAPVQHRHEHRHERQPAEVEISEEGGAALNTEVVRINGESATMETINEFVGVKETTVLVEEVEQRKTEILRESIYEEQTVTQETGATLPVRVERVDLGTTNQVIPEWNATAASAQVISDTQTRPSQVIVERQTLPAIVLRESCHQAPAVTVQDCVMVSMEVVGGSLADPEVQAAAAQVSAAAAAQAVATHRTAVVEQTVHGEHSELMPMEGVQESPRLTRSARRRLEEEDAEMQEESVSEIITHAVKSGARKLKGLFKEAQDLEHEVEGAVADLTL
jgi:hypothetical protein